MDYLAFCYPAGNVAHGVVAVFFIHLDYTPQGLASIYKRFPGPCRFHRQPSSY